MGVQQWQCLAFLAAGLAVGSMLLNLYLVLLAGFWQAQAQRWFKHWQNLAQLVREDRDRGPDVTGGCNGRLVR